ncbi:MAG: hypothetical protein LBB05_00315 [Puniceicoccales bacterium]|jgi:hypothetical protein|nr:hypothetical protein [Puniceicoccales bacterium]
MQAILEKIKDFWADLSDAESWQIFGENVLANPLLKWFVILSVLFLLLRHYTQKGANCIRVYTTHRGPIYMKKSALKGLIKKICHALIPQSKSRVKFCVRWRRIHLRVSVACPHNMQSVSTQLQQEIFSILKQEIGIDNLGSVHVVIEKIIGPIKTKTFNNDSPSTAQIVQSLKNSHQHCFESNDCSGNIHCAGNTGYGERDFRQPTEDSKVDH